MDKSVSECVEKVNGQLREQIMSNWPRLIQGAIEEAPATVSKWHSKKEDGGMHYQTYHATIRRFGVFSSKSGANKNFNEDL
jgi:hypothetical protein